MTLSCRLIALTSLALVACAGSTPAPSGPTPASPSPAGTQSQPTGLRPLGEATIGDRTMCPTSGEEFTVTATSPKVEYQGKTYYFCCGGCDAKFAREPEKYLQKKPDA